jgi:hypothetical protein
LTNVHRNLDTRYGDMMIRKIMMALAVIAGLVAPASADDYMEQSRRQLEQMRQDAYRQQEDFNRRMDAQNAADDAADAERAAQRRHRELMEELRKLRK